MANPDARFGLRPVRHITGAPWNGATIRCYIGALYATALYIGDPVDIESTAANVPTAPRCLQIKRADGGGATIADTQLILGVITSFEPDPTNLTLQYRPASTARYCNVCVDPTVVYQIRGDAAEVPLKTFVGANALGVFTHAGNTITGLSGAEIVEDATPAANSSYPFLVLGPADVEDNEFDGAADTRVIWEVLISTSRFSGSGTDYGLLGVVSA